jgi:Type IV secretion system pilin
MRLSPPRPGSRPPRRGSAPPGRHLRTAITGLAVAAALAVIVLAAGPPASAGTGGVLAAKTIGQVISSTTAWIVGILAGVATLFLTIGGLRYLMAGGDPGEVEKAKTALKSAAIGYGLAILAPVIVTVLKSLVGG